MEAILEPLVLSPKLYQYLEELQAIVEKEEKKRQRFYEEITEYEKAEFINGEIIIHSPVQLRHNLVGKLLLKLLDTFVQIHDLGYVGYEKLLVSLTRNDYEPDLCFFSKEKSRNFNANQMKFPAPAFVAEILSPTTEGRDRNIKFADYAAHGVKEYWIIDPDEETVEQYVLQNQTYRLLLKIHDGTLKSHVVEGFEIPVQAIFDEQENLNALKALMQ